MKAIVTGANGFIGKQLIGRLLSEGLQVVALDIKFDDFLSGNPSVYCVDVSGKTVNELFGLIPEGPFVCFYHLAWVGASGPRRADYGAQLANVQMTCDYVGLCKSLGCKRFLYASSVNEMETYEYLQLDCIEPGGGYIYGTAKMAAHFMGSVVAYREGIEFIPVIITNIFGPGERSERMIYSSLVKLIKGEHCSFTKGDQTYDFIYISDAINSIVAVSLKGKPFTRYYIGSGCPKPLKTFLMEMRDVVSPGAVLGFGDIPFRGIDISYDQFNWTKVREDTGYRNEVSFQEGILKTVEWIKREGL